MILSVWPDDMSQKHIPVDGKIVHDRSVGLHERYCEGIEEGEKKTNKE